MGEIINTMLDVIKFVETQMCVSVCVEMLQVSEWSSLVIKF